MRVEPRLRTSGKRLIEASFSRRSMYRLGFSDSVLSPDDEFRRLTSVCLYNGLTSPLITTYSRICLHPSGKRSGVGWSSLPKNRRITISSHSHDRWHSKPRIKSWSAHGRPVEHGDLKEESLGVMLEVQPIAGKSQNEAFWSGPSGSTLKG